MRYIMEPMAPMDPWMWIVIILFACTMFILAWFSE